MTILSFLSDDHQHCDDLFASAEAAVSDGRWPEATNNFNAFATAMRRHFDREQRVLFPAFEIATGMTMGPTQIMRSEHAQMNTVMEAMQAALTAQDADGYLGQSETLLMLMSQHNMKEEQILYPMCEQRLDGAALVSEMQSMT